MDAEKRCSSCKTTKPLTSFYKDSCSRDGSSSHCKTCRERDRPREAIRGYQRKYRAGNLERINARDRAWYKVNSGEKKAYAKAYAAANRKKIYARKRTSEKREQDELADIYIRRRLGLRKDQAPPALIEAKRAYIKILRLLREKSK